jgi:hypothetical protein
LSTQQNHIALRHSTTSQNVALSFFMVTQGLGLMGVVRHLSRQELALARATSTILTAIGQCDTCHQGRGQQGLAFSGLKRACTGFDADGKAHGASWVKSEMAVHFKCLLLRWAWPSAKTWCRSAYFCLANMRGVQKTVKIGCIQNRRLAFFAVVSKVFFCLVFQPHWAQNQRDLENHGS